MSNYALIKDGVVENIVLWNGEDNLFSEYDVINVDGVEAGIGWQYSDGGFLAPQPPELTADEQIANAEATQIAFRTMADSEIEWRQDAVDAGIATEDETAALAEWKKYRVLLMRVDTADPEWPTPPGQQAS